MEDKTYGTTDGTFLSLLLLKFECIIFLRIGTRIHVIIAAQ